MVIWAQLQPIKRFSYLVSDYREASLNNVSSPAPSTMLKRWKLEMLDYVGLNLTILEGVIPSADTSGTDINEEWNLNLAPNLNL